jgi:hypothetical protein
VSKYVVRRDDGYEVVDLRDALPGADVVAEVVDDEDEDDPLVWLRNPFAGPGDWWWPHNMFAPPAYRLSELERWRRVVAKT